MNSMFKYFDVLSISVLFLKTLRIKTEGFKISVVFMEKRTALRIPARVDTFPWPVQTVKSG